MKTMKRFSAFLVALVMVFSLFAIGVSAWSTGEGIDVYWNGEKVGTVEYDAMESKIQNFGDDTYSSTNNSGTYKSYTGKVLYFNKFLNMVNQADAWEAAADGTTVELKDPEYDKAATLTKAELSETRNYYDKDGTLVSAVKPGFIHEADNTYFQFVFGQKEPGEKTNSNFAKFTGKGNATVKINTPTTPTTPEPAPADDQTQKAGFEVYWNDKSVGTVTYEDMVVDGVSKATSTVTYSTVNKKNTRSEETGYLYKFSQLIDAVKKTADWEAASDNTKVVFETDKPVEFSKKELAEERYYYDENGTQVDKVKAGFLTATKDGKSPFQFAFGQKEATEVNKNRFASFDSAAITKVRITTPIIDVIDAEGKKTELFYSDLVDLWNAEGTNGVGQKYNYTNSNTYPTFKIDEYYGPTLKAVLAKAGIDLDKLADTDVIRFDSTDGKGADVTVKDIKAIRYTFPNGKSTNDYKGTSADQLKDKVEVPYILSVKNGATNIRNVFGQLDPQEQQTSYFIKYINKITVKKDAAKEFTGLKPTIADGSKVKKGDKLNFDLDLPTGVYEGAIYYTVSTDGTEPADPTYADIMYNWSQNRTDDKDYLDAEKSKLYNIYEFTDAEKTIVKVKVYVSGYAEPKAMTLTYTKEEEPAPTPAEPTPVAKLNGLAKDEAGTWGMYKDGVIDETYNGLAKSPVNKKWYSVKNGYVAWDYTGFDQNLETKKWYRVVSGGVDFTAQGIYKKPENGVWYKTTNGRVTWEETGVFKNFDNGTWWRVKNSRVDFTAQGIYKNDNGWWKTTNGKVTFKENGVFKNFDNNTWWKVKGSKVDFDYNGLASNQNGTWKIKGGKVDFGFNGTYQGKTIKGGKVQ